MCHQHISAFVYDKRGRLLSSGQNSYVKTHPLQARIAAEVGEPHKVFLHAGKPLLAKPCKVCHQIIRMTNIKIVEHT